MKKLKNFFLALFNMQKERFECTKENPWKLEYGNFASHEDAKCIRSGEYSDTYKCPYCELEFKVELPDY